MALAGDDDNRMYVSLYGLALTAVVNIVSCCVLSVLTASTSVVLNLSTDAPAAAPELQWEKVNVTSR